MGEDLYELPKGWVWARLDDISEALGGFAFKSQNYTEQGFQIIKIGNIKPGKLNIKDNKTFIDKIDSSILDRYLLESDDILITLTGTRLKRDYGFVTIVKNEKQLLLNQRVARLRFYPPLYPVYFCYSLQSEPFRDNFFQNETGNVGQGNVSMGAIKEEFIPLPPLPEQYRIVAKIEELFTQLDAGVELLKKVKAKLKRYRQAVLKAAVEGNLTKEWRTAHQGESEPASVLLERILKQRREKWEAEQLAKMQAQGKTPKDDSWKLKYKEPVTPDTSDLPDLPDRWCWVNYDQIGEWSGGGTPRTTIADYWENGTIPWVSPKDMKSFKISNSEDKITKIGLENSTANLIKAGSLFFVTRSGILRRILPIALNLVDTAINQDIKALTPSLLLNPEYLLNASLALREDILHTCSKDGTTVESIELSDLRIYPIPLAPLDEQLRIIEGIERLFSIIDQLEKTVDTNIKRAERLRQSILKQAFTGQLVPQDPNDEPAEKLLERIKAEKAQQVATKTKKKTKSQPKSSAQLALPLE
ncbi:MAG: hypothetical protein EA343_05165 [Nodularia sp. (in: Bacteria)]|nr:MAG: hypothetical protein EA343_05165 [Nodularia sp. (in: cyanobacteria)]